MNKPSEKAMMVAQHIMDSAGISFMGMEYTVRRIAEVYDAQIAPYKKTLDEATDALCAIKDLSNLDHMSKARNLALGALDTIRAIKGE